MSTLVKDRATVRQIESLVAKLRRRQVAGAHQTASETVLVLRSVISSAKFSSLEQLVSIIKSVGRVLVDAQPKGESVYAQKEGLLQLTLCPQEHSVGNIVRKVLRLVREEFYAAAAANAASSESGASTPIATQAPQLPLPTTLPTSQSSSSSLANFVLLGHPRQHTTNPDKPAISQSDLENFNKKCMSVKPALIAGVQEVIDEIDTVYESVSKNARDHIHSEYEFSFASNHLTILSCCKHTAKSSSLSDNQRQWKPFSSLQLTTETSPL
ncbi:GCD complex subunit gcd7 [Tulasnella sp. 418]|nr:GCD complex subunit gcd7 [Tulasnella sp. 418]